MFKWTQTTEKEERERPPPPLLLQLLTWITIVLTRPRVHNDPGPSHSCSGGNIPGHGERSKPEEVISLLLGLLWMFTDDASYTTDLVKRRRELLSHNRNVKKSISFSIFWMYRWVQVVPCLGPKPEPRQTEVETNRGIENITSSVSCRTFRSVWFQRISYNQL